MASTVTLVLVWAEASEWAQAQGVDCLAVEEAEAKGPDVVSSSSLRNLQRFNLTVLHIGKRMMT